LQSDRARDRILEKRIAARARKIARCFTPHYPRVR
jgi:hypothetical protein